MGINELGL